MIGRPAAVWPSRQACVLAVALASVLCVLSPAAAGQSDRLGDEATRPRPGRELSTDRPDLTESPFTVERGRLQVELELINGSIDRDRSGGGDIRTVSRGLGFVNVKVGLLDNVDIQFVFEPYVHSRSESRASGTAVTASGFGDVQTRLKINFWGNDDGRTALGIMPFVKWPLSPSRLRSGKTEGGVIVPFSLELDGGWNLGAMTEFDIVHAVEGYRVESFNTVTVGRGISRRLGAYVELAVLNLREPGTLWEGQLGAGVTFRLSGDAQLDAGCNVGLTSSAPDLNSFLGLSWRY
jgi:hypothetical protein